MLEDDGMEFHKGLYVDLPSMVALVWRTLDEVILQQGQGYVILRGLYVSSVVSQIPPAIGDCDVEQDERRCTVDIGLEICEARGLDERVLQLARDHLIYPFKQGELLARRCSRWNSGRILEPIREVHL